ncbi:MAG: hypothetical protein JNM07_04260 [Phycisphaerae bacterium]|nr:hypothetical protein [Phycisphaerae bacterium]
MILLAHRPFLDPLNVSSYWFVLLAPMCLFISIAWKAIRVRSFAGYWREVVVMTAQTLLGMVALAVAFYLLVEVFVRTMQNR